MEGERKKQNNAQKQNMIATLPQKSLSWLFFWCGSGGHFHHANYVTAE